MKKTAVLMLLTVFAAVLCGCYGKTIYDDKELLKIEYSGAEGMGMLPLAYTRTFDLAECAVIDEIRCDERTETEYIEIAKNRYDAEKDGDYADYMAEAENYCNTPETVGSFPSEKRDAFLEYIVQNGVYTWKDEYKTDEILHDYAGFRITFCFADGTEKETRFYAKEPKNYKKIEAAFEDYLGFELQVNYADF